MATTYAGFAMLESTFNSLDVDRILAMYAEDAKFSTNLFGLKEVDKARMREFYTDLFGSNDGVQFQTRAMGESTSMLIWECDVRWKVRKDWPDWGVLRGEEFAMRGVSVLRFRDGLIVEHKDSFWTVRSM
ncbi:hypothetical protein Trco_003683 [Trichoderma cornu-damae]|uniref:SnoaL-like domain-containing protein n=1 Tax=Trichoderma cornu-damae TaxID=654480 RepID=A0A9P8QJ86_9HYPO|nr:hypothetical protein Trco_003683 [Trichoderma cornu-damae]